ncbi:MAG: hypothetical protein QOD72_2311 [Acidimicrobiaceae bacterium]|jgi:hypothetical protein|nr:hypothetical protein [Acidimicrobiaceae bacterium]
MQTVHSELVIERIEVSHRSEHGDERGLIGWDLAFQGCVCDHPYIAGSERPDRTDRGGHLST